MPVDEWKDSWQAGQGSLYNSGEGCALQAHSNYSS